MCHRQCRKKPCCCTTPLHCSPAFCFVANKACLARDWIGTCRSATLSRPSIGARNSLLDLIELIVRVAGFIHPLSASEMSSTTYKMPALLKLPLELLQEICRALAVRRFTNIHLAKVALTCRALYLAANPILWERLPGLEPLLNLMPPERWDSAPLVHPDCLRPR